MSILIQQFRELRKLVIVALAVVVALMIFPASASAGNLTWPQDATLNLSGSGINLTILSGSEADSLSITGTTFTVTVAGGESFTIRYPGPNPGTLSNDGGLPDCNLVGQNNEVTVSGAATVIFTPSATVCSGNRGAGSGPSSSDTASNPLVQPPTGVAIVINSDDATTTSGSVTLGLSATNAATMMLSNDPKFLNATSESYAAVRSWTLPDSQPGTKVVYAKFMNSLGLPSVVVSDAIELVAVDEIVPESNEKPPAAPFDPTIEGVYDPQVAKDATPDIDTDKKLEVPEDLVPPCKAGSRIKGSSMSAVYYCAKDGKRYVFPNERVYFSWFDDFEGITELDDEVLAGISIGGNVTNRPGKKMIKITSDPKTYAVSRGGLLRWVQSEKIAESLYGQDWNRMIDDVDVSFFFNYTIGKPITEEELDL